MYSYDGISSHQATGQILFQWPLHVWSRTRISWGQWGNPGIHGIYLGIYLDHHWQHQIYTKLFRYQKITQTHRGIELFQDFSRRKSSKINTTVFDAISNCKHCGVLIELHVLRDLKRFRVNLVECTSFNFPLVAWLKACLYIWR